MTASSPTSVGADCSVRRESSSESQYLGPLPSRRSTQQPLPQKKALNVSITILSMTGVHLKESTKKKKLFRSNKDNDDVLSEISMADADHEQQPEVGTQSLHQPTTTIVTSFQRTEKQKKIMTHIPSLPLSLPKNSNNNSSTTFNQDIHWPTQDSDAHSKLSSFTFTRYFKREDDETFAAGSKDLTEDTQSGNSTRYAPQLCPIQISISRNGKMFKLGSAHVFISGNEGGLESETGVDGVIKDVPVVNFESAFQAATTTRGLLMSSSSKVNMMRLKGDTLKCGLAERASIRLLIRVTDPEPLPLTERIQVNYTMAKQTSKDPPAQKIEQEDSYEYDPSQSAVVVKKKKTLDGFIEKKNMRFETEQEKNVFRDTQSFGVHSSSSRHGDSVADDNTASDSLSGGSSMVGDDNYSAYSKSSTGLLKMIDDISKHRSRSYGTVTSSFGTVSTSSTMSSGDSYTRRHQEPSSFWVKPIAACKPQWSKHDHWTKRFICCASGSTSGFGEEVQDDLVSIHEESRYSLNERDNSLQHTVDTDVYGAA